MDRYAVMAGAAPSEKPTVLLSSIDERKPDRNRNTAHIEGIQ
jgi:hypothetical protein